MKKIKSVKGIIVEYDDGSHRRVIQGTVLEKVNSNGEKGFSMEVLNVLPKDLIEIGKYFGFISGKI